ncbi:MAG: hypothetical protein HQ594_06195 [Candidatus Omnitrophica bacterium]|nr:hypothetical protein [Candidatus Omnitrophota bacterium]
MQDGDRIRKIEGAIEKLKDLKNIQCKTGNYDMGEYMRGMANGLILAVSVFEEKEPIFFKPLAKKVKP